MNDTKRLIFLECFKLVLVTLAIILLVLPIEGLTLEFTSPILQPELTKPGDKIPLDVEAYSSSLNYTETRDLILVRYEPAYKNVTSKTQTCNATMKNGTNTTTNCWNTTYTRAIRDYTRNGPKIYTYGNPTSIKYASETINFDNKGCWICGDNACCLSDADGYSPYRSDKFKCTAKNECIFRSGEEGIIKNLKTGEKTPFTSGGEPLEI